MTDLPPDTDEKLDLLTKEIDAILADPNTLKNCEKFHRTCSRLTCEDYFREFTI